jgi:hypothetical protein
MDNALERDIRQILTETCRGEIHAATAGILALITAARRPEDMVLVPREPTREMVAAGDFVLFEASLSDGTFGGDAIDTYRAMLSAAPKDPDHAGEDKP